MLSPPYRRLCRLLRRHSGRSGDLSEHAAALRDRLPAGLVARLAFIETQRGRLRAGNQDDDTISEAQFVAACAQLERELGGLLVNDLPRYAHLRLGLALVCLGLALFAFSRELSALNVALSVMLVQLALLIQPNDALLAGLLLPLGGLACIQLLVAVVPWFFGIPLGVLPTSIVLAVMGFISLKRLAAV